MLIRNYETSAQIFPQHVPALYKHHMFSYLGLRFSSLISSRDNRPREGFFRFKGVEHIRPISRQVYSDHVHSQFVSPPGPFICLRYFFTPYAEKLACPFLPNAFRGSQSNFLHEISVDGNFRISEHLLFFAQISLPFLSRYLTMLSTSFLSLIQADGLGGGLLRCIVL